MGFGGGTIRRVVTKQAGFESWTDFLFQFQIAINLLSLGIRLFLKNVQLNGA